MIICGMDECGRGALAGPLVAGAVIFLTTHKNIYDLLAAPLRDSKKLSENQRNRIYLQKDELPIRYSFESISVEEINQLGIAWANREIFLRLSNKLKAHEYMVDGNIKFDSPLRSIVHGDSLKPQIMMASVLAKVYRDSLMSTLHLQYPEYNWARNSGYGTQEHLAALRQHGSCPIHRELYVRSALSHPDKLN